MITVIVDVIAKYNKPRIDNEWFKDRNKYLNINSLDEFCKKKNYTMDNDFLIKTVKEKYNFDNLPQVFSNLDSVLKEEFDATYSDGLFLQEISFDIIKISGIINV